MFSAFFIFFKKEIRFELLVYIDILINLSLINPQPPSDAVRKQKNYFRVSYSSVLSQLKKYHPSGNMKFNNLGIFQSLKLCNLTGKILQISVKLNFFPSTLGC